MRKLFAKLLYNKMSSDENIYFITADLGFGLFDEIKKDFPSRFYNTGAAEQAAMGVAVGLALSGKTPVLYSITPFLLFRAAETIRNYVNHEVIGVKLIASGRGDDYKHDGFSHYAGDDKHFIELFKSVIPKWPEDDNEMVDCFNDMFSTDKPYYLNLKR